MEDQGEDTMVLVSYKIPFVASEVIMKFISGSTPLLIDFDSESQLSAASPKKRQNK